ncbi:tape measure domain containing protein [Thermoanaerobacter thermohydrosulfuricus WC1]|uniref:Tape measure domain containing protein n=1 Tax=Thermoanaerobacter thermohydrosulfuricus WC1 TaxID=1198630 RepID=M8CUN2_THETY|nr:tape measure protein [Thermoanaerobacter thermohydrosulfuricus]EMT38139.1 tape measure domain containing protein [Thermoanaerobacter thermohydrosulfuricus WC1]
MAESEIYRIEIPIIVDDQSEAPIERARERVNRFQRSAEKTNERLRRMAAREYRLGISTRDRVSPTLSKIQRNLYGIANKTWKITLQAKDKATDVIKRAIGFITSPLALLGAGAGATAAVTFPLKLAADFEQAQMSLDFYLGSAEKGKKAFEDLVEFAAKTPFEFPFLQQSMIMLMGAGYSYDKAKRALIAFGDAAGRTGAGMSGIENAMIGFTQIASAGTLNLQDLKQVALNLRVPLNIFAKELGVAESELGNIGEKGIPAQKAMEAIVRTLEKRFGGGMQELSESLSGLMSTLKDTARLAVYSFGKGMEGPVKRILLDLVDVTDYSSARFQEFQRKLEDAGRRVGEKFEYLYQSAKKFFDELTMRKDWQQADWGGKLGILIDKAAKIVIPKMVKLGADLGIALGENLVNALANTILDNPLAAVVFGILAGIYTPGPIQLKVTIAVGIIAAPLIKKLLEWIVGGAQAIARKIPGTEAYVEAKVRETSKTLEKFEHIKKTTPRNEPIFKGTAIEAPKHAAGGIFTQPHLALVAEAGPEAIIPLSGYRSRAMNLWLETGRQLGIYPRESAPFGTQNKEYSSFSTSTTNFNPVINVYVNNTKADPEEIAEAIATKIEKIYSNSLRKK